MILGIPPNRVQNHSCYVSIKELIEDKVLSQWADYLKKKFVNEDKETGITPRSDTVWKKIFRDLREFFRILFKSRFHPLDYKTGEQADKWCIVLLNELGIETDHLNKYQIRKIFYFFHQTRLNSSDRYASEHFEKEGEICNMDIIEKYKDSIKESFLVDRVSSKLFYTVYYNFDYIYNWFLKHKYKGIVDKIIANCLKSYDEGSDIRKIISN